MEIDDVPSYKPPFILDFPSYKPPFLVDFPWLCQSPEASTSRTLPPAAGPGPPSTGPAQGSEDHLMPCPQLNPMNPMKSRWLMAHEPTKPHGEFTSPSCTVVQLFSRDGSTDCLKAKPLTKSWRPVVFTSQKVCKCIYRTKSS